MGTRKRTWILRATVLAVLGTTAAGAPPAADPGLDELAWLTGCWAGVKDNRRSEECWTAPAGGMMLGLHRDLRGDGTASFEFLRIAVTAEGLVYYASPGGRQPPIPFRRIAQAPRRVVFENAEHDFPQRILYWRDDDQILHARIEGELQGELQAVEWQWRAVPLVPDPPSPPPPGSGGG